MTQQSERAMFEAARVYVRRLYGAGRRPARLAIVLDDGETIRLPVPVSDVAGETAAENPPTQTSQRKHGPDFRSIVWDGERYSFTEPQAQVVKVLWEAYEEGFWEVGDRILLAAAQSESVQLGDVFKKCPAWNKLIVEGATRGTHRLADKDPTEAGDASA